MPALIKTAQLSSAKKWLDVVRSNGRGFVFALKNKQPMSIGFNDHNEALLKIDHLVSDGCDVFVGIANVLPNSTSRIAKNVTELHALFIDLDCGPNKPYLSQHNFGRLI